MPNLGSDGRCPLKQYPHSTCPQHSFAHEEQTEAPQCPHYDSRMRALVAHDRGFGNDATASSSFAYTLMAVSSLVRRSNSVKRGLEETSLGTVSESLFRVKK